MDKEQIANKMKNISNKYKKIHKIIFSYGIFFIIGIIAITKAYNILSQEQGPISETNILNQQKEVKIQKFLKQVNQIHEQSIFSGKIALENIEETNEYIKSYNNLLTYKGFVIPRFFWVSKTAPIQPKSYFDNQTYSLDEINTLYKNIFIGSNRDRQASQPNVLFPIKEGIIQDFNINCLFENKIGSFICNIFTNNFINNFFVSNIETDIANFEKVIKKIIKQDKNKDRVCKNLLYYTYYTQKTIDTIELLISQCGEEYEKSYSEYKNFLEVQKELDSKFISNKIYKTNNINIYKLISFQQIINDDISNQRINTDRIKGYFNYIQELLKNEKLDSFYKELTYFFNNYYIKEAIENVTITSNMQNKTDVDIIQKQITSINNGNVLIGFKGLKDKINKNILEEGIITINETGDNNNYEQKIDSLLQQINDIEIKQKYLSGSDILIYGIWTIEKDTQTTKGSELITIPTKLRLKENKNTLYVMQVVLGDYENINQIVNKLILQQKRTFTNLQKYINQNKFLFETTSTNTSEDTIICKSIVENLPEQEVKNCNNNRIDIDILWKNKVITMTILHDNFLLKEIDINDEDAKKVLNNYLQDPDIISKLRYEKVTKNEIVEFIKETINGFLTFEPKNDQNFTGSTNTIIIIERVKEYLGVQVKDIVEKNGKILIDFTVGGIPFLGYYTLNENKISPLYFKEANQTKTPVLIKNISLTLTDQYKSFLSTFSLQPLEVIKQYSPEEYLLYQKFISEKIY